MRKNLMVRIAAVCTLALCLATGCNSLPRCPKTKPKQKAEKIDLRTNEPLNVIELDGEGTMYDLSTNAHTKLPGAGGVTNYLTRTIWQGFRDSGKTNLLIFVHGGMNSRDVGLQHYLDDFKQIDGYYPVFIVWPSGPLSTYLEHLFLVRQGIKMETAKEKTFSFLTSPFMLVADLGRAVTRLPMVIANNTRSDFETITPIRKQDRARMVDDYRELATNHYQVHIEDDYSRTQDRFIRDVSYWATLPVKYVVSSLLDGLGQGAWDDMLRRTETAYPGRMEEWLTNRVAEVKAEQSTNVRTQSGARKTPRKSKKKEKRLERYEAAGLPAFFEMLPNIRTTNGTIPQITLVGHSMGAIILNRVVRDTKIEFTNIVYMGAACSIEDFSTSVLPYMRQHTNSQFYSLSLHPVAEAGEVCWMAADLVPRGSLLIWLDNFLMNPVTEQERTFGRWRNLFRTSATGEPVIKRFFANPDSESLKQRLHFRAFSVGAGDQDQMRPMKYQWNDNPRTKTRCDRCDTPLAHGDFTEMPYWSKDYWWKE
jgi:pimeloyl-ACP methyl ester carboxylesterase